MAGLSIRSWFAAWLFKTPRPDTVRTEQQVLVLNTDGSGVMVGLSELLGITIPVYTLATEPAAVADKFLLYAILDGTNPSRLYSLRFKFPGNDTPVDLGSVIQ